MKQVNFRPQPLSFQAWCDVIFLLLHWDSVCPLSDHWLLWLCTSKVPYNSYLMMKVNVINGSSWIRTTPKRIDVMTYTRLILCYLDFGFLFHSLFSTLSPISVMRYDGVSLRILTLNRLKWQGMVSFLMLYKAKNSDGVSEGCRDLILFHSED